MIKSYTDIEQSKKLVKILPLKSADMYRVFENNAETRVYYGKIPTAYFVCEPCWSLAALLSILPPATLDISNDHYCRFRCQQRCTEWHDNPIDACYEMILKLHEKNLL